MSPLLRIVFLCFGVTLAGCATSGPSAQRAGFDLTARYAAASGEAAALSRTLVADPARLADLQRLDAEAHAAVLPVREAAQARRAPAPDAAARADAAVDDLEAFVLRHRTHHQEHRR